LSGPKRRNKFQITPSNSDWKKSLCSCEILRIGAGLQNIPQVSKLLPTVEDAAAGFLALAQDIELTPEVLEKAMITHPQVECSLIHRFGPGIYIRELHMKAGTFAVGHTQKFEHTNIILKGKVMMVNEDGSNHILEAPLFFIGKPGRKVGYVLEDVVWQNIYATEDRDIDALEARFVDKSPFWIEQSSHKFIQSQIQHESDREDFFRLSKELDPEAEVYQSENLLDVSLPIGDFSLRICKSAIHGRGLFATANIPAGDVVCKTTIASAQTVAGMFINHSTNPNSVASISSDGDTEIIAIRDISGCRGGDSGEEITINYRQALSLPVVGFKE
jgi:hypothetical protein